MAKIVSNTAFFKAKAAPKTEEPKRQEQSAASGVSEAVVAPLRLQPEVTECVRQSVQLLQRLNQPKLAQAAELVCRQAAKERFTVAVVGEFSRGKSSFLNKLLGKDVLPVGNLPTTALLTRIRHYEKPVLLSFDVDGKRRAAMPLAPESWDGLVADNLMGEDPTGMVLVGLNDPWLKQTNIELIDTPGAGDLEKSRAQAIGEALLGADGAIITVSAAQALSMSEKLFIEQRLIARKTPFLMLILTKLDQVPKRERLRVLEYVRTKLRSWNMDIPVFIPYEVEMPDDSAADIMGMDAVRAHILSWVTDPKRAALTQEWLISRTLSVVSTAQSALAEKKALMDSDASARAEKIRKKKEALQKAQIAWEDLRIEMLNRCSHCYQWLNGKAEEYITSITERLQYEATMSGNPQKWWKESYPYRLKIELTNMASAVDNGVSKRVAGDAAWLNAALEKQFKTHVLVNHETIADKSMFGDFSPRHNVQFENIDAQRNTARIGTTVLTIAGALLCSSFGAFPLIATMGIGTGSSIITEHVFKGKIEHQRDMIRDAIAQNVPELLNTAMRESERRLQAVYADIIRGAEEQEAIWMQAQNEAIAQSLDTFDTESLQLLVQDLHELDTLTAQLVSLNIPQ